MKEWFTKMRYKLAYWIAPDWIDDLEHRLSAFLLNQTGGRLSKCYYSAETMIREAQAARERECEECEYYLACRENDRIKDGKSRDLLKYGEAVSQGFQDGMKDAEQWRQYRERIISEAGDAASRAGEALGRAANGICDFFRAMIDLAGAIITPETIHTLQHAAEMDAALNEAPPRVRHLALHSKKRRVNKKNINRALREYRRKEKVCRSR